MLLEGKVAIVSGVGLGLGRATALALAREGADVALGARTRSTLEAVAREVEALGRKGYVIPADITKEDQVKEMADAAFRNFGRIDILVNNVGWTGPMTLLTETTVQEWRETLDGNVVGTMMVCKYTVPYMVRAKGGAIINITSQNMRRGASRRSAYAASKAAITLLTQSLASELGPSGIRANCVVPGHIWSDRLKAFYESQARQQGKTYEQVYASLTEQMALRRIPTAEEIANAIVFLASDWASAITGQSLDVNAGLVYH